MSDRVAVRLVKPVGSRVVLETFFGSSGCGDRPNQRHHATAYYGLVDQGVGTAAGVPEPRDIPAGAWPTTCSRCGATTPIEQIPWDGRLIYRARVWDTPTGEIRPGDLYYEACGAARGHACANWADCDGHHLIAVLPAATGKGPGHHWDLAGRASNCDRPADRHHRCWIHQGEPGPGLHVDKGERIMAQARELGAIAPTDLSRYPGTCNAGAGSIIAPDGWHGFLHDGLLLRIP
ncbi:hypothetical protein D3C72_774330 [compost metagenome]